MRSFRDSAGRLWGAFAVTPDAMLGVRIDVLPDAFASGWLVFESADERRRLAPFPGNWQDCPEDVLCRLLDEAGRVKRHAPHLVLHDLAENPSPRADL